MKLSHHHSFFLYSIVTMFALCLAQISRASEIDFTNIIRPAEYMPPSDYMMPIHDDERMTRPTEYMPPSDYMMLIHDDERMTRPTECMPPSDYMMPIHDDERINPNFPEDDEIIANHIPSANIEIDFILGTAFVAWIVTRDGLTKKLTNLGTRGIGDKVILKLPIHSRIKIGVQGFLKHCRYFTVVKPGYCKLKFWGIADASHFRMFGEALHYDHIANVAGGCVNP